MIKPPPPSVYFPPIYAINCIYGPTFPTPGMLLFHAEIVKLIYVINSIYAFLNKITLSNYDEISEDIFEKIEDVLEVLRAICLSILAILQGKRLKGLVH